MVVTQHLAKQVDGLLSDQLVVSRGDELVPGLAWVVAQDVVVVRVQLHVVLLNIGEQLVSTKHLRDLHQLVVVVLALEEGLLLEDHTGEHAAQGPNVE